MSLKYCIKDLKKFIKKKGKGKKTLAYGRFCELLDPPSSTPTNPVFIKTTSENLPKLIQWCSAASPECLCMNFVLKETPLGPHHVSLLAWCLSDRESTKRRKERQGPHSVIFYN